LLDLSQMATYRSQQFTAEEKDDYRKAREAFLSDARYKDAVPETIAQSPSLIGLHSRISQSSDSEARRHDIYTALGPLRFRVLAGREGDQAVASHDPSKWTGMLSQRQRLSQVRTMLPVAMVAIENLIAELEKPGDNGGPILDHNSEAVETLRKLHAALGGVLSAIDDGSISDNFGEGLPAEAARYAIRAAEVLKDDPLPYSVSAMLLAIFSLLGFTEAGAWISAVAVTFTKSGKS